MNWLNTKEVQELTKFKQPQKQREALNQMGIPCVVRPDGTIVVFKSDLTVGKRKEVRFVIDA